jgi:WD40 repeat protein
MTLNMDSGINSVAFSRDGSLIAAGLDNALVQVWDALTGKEKHVLNGHTHSGQLSCIFK